MLAYFMTIWNILCIAIWFNLFFSGIVCDHLLHFRQFGMFGPRKIWQPLWACLVSTNGLAVTN
jgi:hypothetical protein